MEEKITITVEEYNRLIRHSCTLQALRGAGVDNWSGYGEHCEYEQELLKEYGLKDK